MAGIALLTLGKSLAIRRVDDLKGLASLDRLTIYDALLGGLPIWKTYQATELSHLKLVASTRELVGVVVRHRTTTLVGVPFWR